MLHNNVRGASVYSTQCCPFASVISEDKPVRKLGPACRFPPSQATLQRYKQANETPRVSYKEQRLVRRMEWVTEKGCFLPSARRAFPSEFTSWYEARRRAINPKPQDKAAYSHVTFYSGWENFESFIQDMGRKPDPSYTIDRIDPWGGYNPDNCRWASKQVQARNKR